MPPPATALRLAAYLAYLAAWLTIACATLAHALSRRHRAAAAPVTIGAPLAIGTLLQAAAFLPLTLSSRPLATTPWPLAAAIPLALLGAALFLWAQLSVPHNTPPGALITTRAYAHLRHPIYAAFLALFAATALLATPTPAHLPALALYLAGTELRIATEESELTGYSQYRQQTKWRYLPGLR